MKLLPRSDVIDSLHVLKFLIYSTFVVLFISDAGRETEGGDTKRTDEHLPSAELLPETNEVIKTFRLEPLARL